MRRLQAIAALMIAITIVAAACGDDDDDAGNGDGTTTTAADSTTGAAGGDGTTTSSSDGDDMGLGDLEGSFAISGSSTVEPISADVAEQFAAVAPGVAIAVTGPGTSDGFAQFCAGEIPIADASRAIRDSEIAECSDAGIEFTELYIGVDALTVATNPANAAVTCLTFADLYALTGPESTGVDNWADAQTLAAELGSTTEFPDAPLRITAPGEESGTFDFYVEAVIEPLAEERGLPEDDWTTRPDYTSSPNDNVIVEGIEGSDTSLGWVGFAFYQAEASRLKAIEVDGGEGCVAPSIDSALDGSYPISRPLFIYVSAAGADDPAVAAFVDFYLSVVEDTVARVGYAPLPGDALAETMAAWEGR